MDYLRTYKDVFVFPQSNYSGRSESYVTLHEMLKTPGDRTRVVGEVIKCLGEELIPGIRNEVLSPRPIIFVTLFFHTYYNFFINFLITRRHI